MAFDFDVFVSYAQSDIEFARHVVSWLRESRTRVWFAEEQLVPGSRFRAGLQQGVRECQHLVAILTSAYIQRPWTQRELDLFDLSAGEEDRRILCLQLEDVQIGSLDQVLQVHQRIPWVGRGFDAAGFWLLYCGLTKRPPGPRSEWTKQGKSLRRPTKYDSNVEWQNTQLQITSSPTRFDGPDQAPMTFLDEISKPSSNAILADFLELVESTRAVDVDLINRVLNGTERDWPTTFDQLRSCLRHPSDGGTVVRSKIVELWASGHCQAAAVLALASDRLSVDEFGSWALLDCGLFDVARSFLLFQTMSSTKESEVWFSWAIAEMVWPLLSRAAIKAPAKPCTPIPHVRCISTYGAMR